MISTQFDYVAAATLDEAVALLAQHGDDAKILAGGHSLIPAMKLRLAMPQVLIDIGQIKDLAYVREDGNTIAIGAMATHYQIESSALLRKICPLLPETAASIGDVQVRNRGTIGGSVVHADPAADWPAAMAALGAEMVAVGRNGQRTIPAASFFVDMLTSALEPGEILREIRIPRPSGNFGQAYLKNPQPASGFALVGVAVHLVLDASGACQSVAVGVTGTAVKVYRATGTERALTGKIPNAAAIADAASHAADGVDANSDIHSSAEYRRHLTVVYARRAIEAALSRAH
ncbi:MAG: FAD binding domain-containing protein [Bryobacteraceae bacterium]